MMYGKQIGGAVLITDMCCTYDSSAAQIIGVFFSIHDVIVNFAGIKQSRVPAFFKAVSWQTGSYLAIFKPG